MFQFNWDKFETSYIALYDWSNGAFLPILYPATTGPDGIVAFFSGPASTSNQIQVGARGLLALGSSV